MCKYCGSIIRRSEDLKYWLFWLQESNVFSVFVSRFDVSKSLCQTLVINVCPTLFYRLGSNFIVATFIIALNPSCMGCCYNVKIFVEKRQLRHQHDCDVIVRLFGSALANRRRYHVHSWLYDVDFTCNLNVVSRLQL